MFLLFAHCLSQYRIDIFFIKFILQFLSVLRSYIQISMKIFHWESAVSERLRRILRIVTVSLTHTDKYVYSETLNRL